MRLLFPSRTCLPYSRYLNRCSSRQTSIIPSAHIHKASESTYSAACSGVRIACNDLTVDPSDISAKANRFCFLTDRTNPFNVISSFSYICAFFFSSAVVVVVVAFESSAHRNRLAARGLDGVYRLTTDVENERRHARIASARLQEIDLTGNSVWIAQDSSG